MKVILLQDVAKIGRRSEVKDVPDGYAQNQLIPKRMAEPATPANLKKIKKKQAEIEVAKANSQARFAEIASKLKDKVIKVPFDVNEKGHTFKAISGVDLTEALSREGIEIDQKLIVIDEPIKSVGEHAISLVSGESKTSLKIEVVKK